MATAESRVVVIAEIIDRYVTDHPRAVDTAEGIGSWWIAEELYRRPLETVQGAVDYLVERGRLARIELADGTVVYARAPFADG